MKMLWEVWELLKTLLIIFGGIFIFLFVGALASAFLIFCFFSFSNWANKPLFERDYLHYTEEDFNDYVGDAVRVDYQPRSWGVEEKWTVVTDRGEVLEKDEPVAEGQPVYEK